MLHSRRVSCTTVGDYATIMLVNGECWLRFPSYSQRHTTLMRHVYTLQMTLQGHRHPQGDDYVKDKVSRLRCTHGCAHCFMASHTSRQLA